MNETGSLQICLACLPSQPFSIFYISPTQMMASLSHFTLQVELYKSSCILVYSRGLEILGRMNALLPSGLAYE